MNADSTFVQDRRQIQLRRLPVLDSLAWCRAVDLADRLVERAEAQLREVARAPLRRCTEEVLDELRLAGETLAQHRVLRRDTHGAGVEVADAHHDAARDHERRGGETELLAAEQRRDHDVATRLQLAVDLHDDAVAKTVEQQRLLGLGQAELPRCAGVLDRGQRRRAGATVVTGDEHHVGVRLGDTGRDGADADLGDQLHVDAGLRVGVLQVVDQLGEILDRVDVVVRRRRDQADARRGAAHLGDPRVHLVRRKLAALAGLGSLRHLDLDVGAVASGSATMTPKRPDATCLIAERRQSPFSSGVKRDGMFAALTGIRAAAETVHRDRESLVGLGGDGAVAHRTRGEPLDDLARRLDLVDRASTARRPVLNSNRPRSDARRSDWSSTSFVYSLNTSY